MVLRAKTVWFVGLLAMVALVMVGCGAATTQVPAAPAATSAPVEEPAATTAPAVAATEAPQAEAGGAAAAGLRTFVVVPEESRASYVVDEEFFADALTKLGIAAGLVDTIGSTQEVAGQLQLNLDDLSAPIGENRFTVEVNTLSSDQSQRDKWIRENGPTFNSFPAAEFVATGVEGAPGSYTEGEEVQFKMPGNLTVRGITQPVTFDVTAKLQDGTIKGVATARLLMSGFGIEPPNFLNTLTVADEFGLEIEITAREQ